MGFLVLSPGFPPGDQKDLNQKFNSQFSEFISGRLRSLFKFSETPINSPLEKTEVNVCKEYRSHLFSAFALEENISWKKYLRITLYSVYICQRPKQGQLIQRLFVLIVRKRQCAQIFSLWFTFQIYTYYL